MGNSAYVTSNDLAIRSRATADMTQTTSFSAYFLYEATSTLNSSFIGMGWARADNRTGNNGTGIDGNNPFNVGQSNRFEFGLGTTGSGTTVQFVSFGQLGATTVLTGGVGDTLSTALTVNNWYQLSGDITFNFNNDNTSNFDLANLAVRAWGSDGLTGGSTIMSMASQTGINLFAGSNFDTDSNGYAYVSGNQGRGVDSIDNISVTAIPEPSSALLSLLFGVGSLALLGRKRA